MIERPEPVQPIPSHAKRVFQGVIFDIYQWEQEMYDGSKKIFEKARRAANVTIFGILPDGKIILTEQEQPGKPLFLAATGGRVEDGEDVLDAAKREFLEETGYEVGEFVVWFTENSLPKVDWPVYVLLAKSLKKVAEPQLDNGEKIKLKPVTFEDFINLPELQSVYFAEEEIMQKLLEAKLYPEKMKEIEELFKPKEA